MMADRPLSPLVARKGWELAQPERYQYDSTNARVQLHDYALDRYKSYVNVDGTTLAEFTEFTIAVPGWTKSYTYFRASQLATITPNGSGGEITEFSHPNRLARSSSRINQPVPRPSRHIFPSADLSMPNRRFKLTISVSPAMTEARRQSWIMRSIELMIQNWVDSPKLIRLESVPQVSQRRKL